MPEEFEKYYSHRLTGYLRRMRVPLDEIDDLSQEIYLRFYRSMERLEKDRDPLPYLFTIARNERIRWVRKNMRQLEVEKQALVLNPAQPTTLVEEQVEAREASKSLKDALESLNPDQKEALVLKHYQNLTFREVSEVLSIPEATVKSRVYKALIELKARIA